MIQLYTDCTIIDRNYCMKIAIVTCVALDFSALLHQSHQEHILGLIP